MGKISPTSRTLEFIRSKGWMADIVERFNPHAGKFGKKKDMFGFADIVAVGERKIIAIQSCGNSFAEHYKKITEDEKVVEKALKWLECPSAVILLIAWRKLLVKRGGKAKRYMPRIHRFRKEDFTSS